MKIKVSPLKCVLGGEGKGYHFPGAEILSDGSVYVVARRDKGMNDPYGGTDAVKYIPSEDRIVSMPAPNEQDLKRAGKYSYGCYVTELSPNELIAIYGLLTPEGHSVMFDEKMEGICLLELRITRSHDGGMTWDAPEDVAYKANDYMVPAKIIKTKDGIVGFHVEMHNHWEEDYREPVQARFIYSTDGGKTYDKVGLIPHEDGFLAGDARDTVDEDGNICAFFWGFDLKEKKDMAIYRSFSKDGGRTFSHVEPINLKKQITSPFKLKNDVMMCIYQERFSEHPGLYAALSYDGGMNWDEENAVGIFVKGASPKSLNAFDSGNDEAYKFGYSTLTKLSDNSALVTFWHSLGDSTGVSICTLTVENQ